MAKRKYKIALLTSFDPLDKTKLSGTSFYLYQCLKKYFNEVEILGPAPSRNFLERSFKSFLNRTKIPYNTEHSYFLAFKYARFFKKRIKNKEFDFIIAPRASTEIALLNTTIPIIYFSDTTFHSMYGYYHWFSNFLKISVWEGNSIEQLAIDKSLAAIFASDWAANSAINYYQAPANKVSVIPLGPNIDYVPDREELDFDKDNATCQLLFLGVEWERKGGPIAFETLLLLQSMGIKAHLTICGCNPPSEFQNENLTIIPYLNKNNKNDNDKVIELLKTSHFMIVPTRAECFGVVFSEASAYAIPSITTDTGGISSVVKNGVNGYRIGLEQGAESYATIIAEIFIDYEHKYLPLMKSTRNYFDTDLSWDVFGKKLINLIESL